MAINLREWYATQQASPSTSGGGTNLKSWWEKKYGATEQPQPKQEANRPSLLQRVSENIKTYTPTEIFSRGLRRVTKGATPEVKTGDKIRPQVRAALSSIKRDITTKSPQQVIAEKSPESFLTGGGVTTKSLAKDQRTFLSEAGKSAQLTTFQLAENTARLQAKVSEKLGIKQHQYATQKAAEYFHSIVAKHPEWQPDPAILKKELGAQLVDPGYYGYLIGNVAPTLVASFATGGVGALVAGGSGAVAAAAASSFIMESAAAYQNAKESGANDTQALTAAGFTGTINAMLDTLPIGRIFGRISGGRALKRHLAQEIVNEIAKQGAFEGTTEALQEIVGNTVARVIYDQNGEIFNRAVLDSFIGGALSGGIVGGGTSALTNIKPTKPGTVADTATVFGEDVTFSDKPVIDQYVKQTYDRNVLGELPENIRRGDQFIQANTTEEADAAIARAFYNGAEMQNDRLQLDAMRSDPAMQEYFNKPEVKEKLAIVDAYNQNEDAFVNDFIAYKNGQKESFNDSTYAWFKEKVFGGKEYTGVDQLSQIQEAARQDYESGVVGERQVEEQQGDIPQEAASTGLQGTTAQQSAARSLLIDQEDISQAPQPAVEQQATAQQALERTRIAPVARETTQRAPLSTQATQVVTAQKSPQTETVATLEEAKAQIMQYLQQYPEGTPQERALTSALAKIEAQLVAKQEGRTLNLITPQQAQQEVQAVTLPEVEQRQVETAQQTKQETTPKTESRLDRIARVLAKDIRPGDQDFEVRIDRTLRSNGINLSNDEFGTVLRNVQEIVRQREALKKESAQAVGRVQGVTPRPRQFRSEIKLGEKESPVQKDAVKKIVKKSSFKSPGPREFGAEAIKRRLDLEVSKKEIRREEAEAIKRFIDLISPELISDVGLSIQKESGGPAGTTGRVGTPDGIRTIISIFKSVIGRSQTGNVPKVTIHELWHALTPYISPKYVSEFRKVFEAERGSWLKKLTTEERKTFDEIKKRVELDKSVNKGLLEKAPENFYRYTTLDEWFAETMADRSLAEIKKAYKPYYRSTWDAFIEFFHSLMRSVRHGFDLLFNRNKARVDSFWNLFLQHKLSTRYRRAVGLEAARVSLNMSIPQDQVRYADKFGHTYVRESIPVDRLVSDPKYQPRTTESAKATEESVFKNGYQEGLVTQPMVVLRNGKDYTVLGGHSRTLGLQRREAQGLQNPETVIANVYENLTETEAKQIARAANQQTSEESLLDKAKSINESLAENQEPQVPLQNMKRGFVAEDYAMLWELVQKDPTGNLKPAIEIGKIDEGNALNIANQARLKELSIEDVLGILQVIDKKGQGLSYERVNRLSASVQLAKNTIKAKTGQASLFGETGLTDAIATIDNEYEERMREVRRTVSTIRSMGKVAKQEHISVPEEWDSLLARKEVELQKLQKREVDTLVRRWEGTQPENEKAYRDRRIYSLQQEISKVQRENTKGDLDSKEATLRKEIRLAEAAYGKQAYDADLSKVDEALTNIPDGLSTDQVADRVLEIMSREGERLSTQGYVWLDGRWIRDMSQPPTDVPPGKGPLPYQSDEAVWNTFTEEDRQQDDMPEELHKALVEMIRQQDALANTIVTEGGGEATTKDGEPAHVGLIERVTDRFVYPFASPHIIFPEAFRVIYPAYHRFFLFKQKYQRQFRDVFNKYGIKRNGKVAEYLKSIVDGSLTEKQQAELTQLSQAEQDRLRNAALDWKAITDELWVKLKDAGVLDENQYVQAYAPHSGLSKTMGLVRRFKSIKNFVFKNALSRQEQSAIDPNIDLIDLMDAYLGGMGKQLFLKDAVAQTEGVIAQYEGSRKKAAYEWLNYLQQPRHVSAASLYATRLFASQMLGIRTQIKNFMWGNVLMFAEGGVHYNRMLHLLVKNPKRFRDIAGGAMSEDQEYLNQISVAERFGQEILPEIIGTYGTQAEFAKSIVDKIIRNMPSAKAMQVVEGTIRPMAYVTGYLKGEKLGLTGEDLDYYAWNFVNDTQFNPTFLDLPAAWRGRARPFGQFVITRLKATERILQWFQSTDPRQWQWGKILRYFTAGPAVFLLASAIWPDRERTTKEGVEYSSGGVDWLESIDIFDIRKVLTVMENHKKLQESGTYLSSFERFYDVATSLISGFFSPLTTFTFHLIGFKSGLDKIYRDRNATVWEMLQEDLFGDELKNLTIGQRIAQPLLGRATVNDSVQLLRAMNLWGYEPRTSVMNTVLGANELIRAAEKAGDKAEVQRIKEKYPMYRYKSLAEQYSSKISSVYKQTSDKRSKIKKRKDLTPSEKQKQVNELEAQQQRNVLDLINEFNDKLRDRMSADGLSMLDILGIGTAKAAEIAHMEQVTNEGVPRTKLLTPHIPGIGPSVDPVVENQSRKNEPMLEAMVASAVLGQTYNPLADRPSLTAPVAEERSVNTGVIASTPKELTPTIESASEKYGVPANILSSLLKQETGFRPSLYDQVTENGSGIAQFTGIAIKELNRLGYPFSRADALVPERAINAAAFFLSVLKERTGSWWGAVRSYNGNNALTEDGEPVKDMYVRSVFNRT